MKAELIITEAEQNAIDRLIDEIWNGSIIKYNHLTDSFLVDPLLEVSVSRKKLESYFKTSLPTSNYTF